MPRYNNGDESSRSTDEDNAREAGCKTKQDWDERATQENGTSSSGRGTGRQGVPQERRTSCSTPRKNQTRAFGHKDQRGDYPIVNAGDARLPNGQHHIRRVSHGHACSQRLRNDCVDHGNVERKRRTRDTKEGQHTRRRGYPGRHASNNNGVNRKENGLEEETNPDGSNTNASDREKDGSNERSEVESKGRKSCKEAFTNGGSGDGKRHGLNKKRDTGGVKPQRAQSPRDAGTSCEQGIECYTGRGRKGLQTEDGDGFINNHIESTELDKRANCNHLQNEFDEDGHHAAIGVQEAPDNLAPGDKQKCANQNEAREFDQQQVDISTPPVEELFWDGPRQGNSATSRLHRHISQTDAKITEADDPLPPPKEFLTSRPLNFPVSVQPDEQNGNTNNLHTPESEQVGSASKRVGHGRRRSAADLEWSNGVEARDVRFGGTTGYYSLSNHGGLTIDSA